MKPEEFVQALKTVLIDGLSESTLKYFTNEPNAKWKPTEVKKIASWYDSLAESDKLKVNYIIKECFRSSVFGLLCILDGIRQIENPKSRGKLELWYTKNNKRILLNNCESTDFLHDLL